MASHQFINSKQGLVRDAIDGLIACSGGALTRLDGYPHIKVVLRSDWRAGEAARQVALISGGGSGHEPAHAGFVGPGLLTAAVCGEVFASPSVDAVLAAILAVTGEAGCLLIVKNYTGDRLNFGLAAERARALGKAVEMVVVADDIALPDQPQARGLAGTLFVHKIAGAMAQRGAQLAEVAAAARRVSAKVASIGTSLDTCTVPGADKQARIPEGKAELGLGIHGEPGAEQVAFTGAQDSLTLMLERLRATLTDEADEPETTCVALLNNLGATTPLELSVLSKTLAEDGIAERIIGPAAMMTSLDMHGFSLSLLRATDAELAALAEPVPLAAWPGLVSMLGADPANPAATAITPLPDGLSPIAPIASDNPRTRTALIAVADALIDAEADLNALDAKSGDGDTGSTLATAARSLKDGLDRLPLADLTQLFPALGNALSQSMGGSSGVILAIYFNAAGDACAKGATVPDALRAGLARVSEVGGAQLGDRTMIDALHPALEALEPLKPLETETHEFKETQGGLAAAARAARAGADATAAIHSANAGRAAYVPSDNLKGHNDPGAEAVAVVFARLAEVAEVAEVAAVPEVGDG